VKIHVKCFSTLIKENECNYSDARPLEMNPGATVTDLIHNLDLPQEKIKIIFVNGQHGEINTTLQEGDRVAFAPATFGIRREPEAKS